MYASIFRNVVFPALDVVNGTRINAVLGQLGKTERASRDELVAMQKKKLARMLEVVKKESAFYREHWEKAPDDRRPSSSHPELDGLPVVTKEELREAPPGSFPLPSHRGRTIKVNTSGSTGRPMTYLRSAEQESWFWAMRIRMWQWAGFRLGEPYMAINLNARTLWKKRLQDVLFRCTYLSYNADNQDSAKIVDLLGSRHVTHVNAFGSTLLALAQHMVDHDVKNPGVRVLTSTGDNLFPPQRELIERAFGVGVNDYYGAGGEGIHLASQCEVRDRYHVHPENAVMEVLKDGRPARPGEVGTIVVTQLDNFAMPLVRYELGDLATLTEDRPCPCGRAHPATVQSVNGRACDMIRTSKGAVLLPQYFFIGAFKMLEKVERYQVVQDELSGITIKLVAEEGCDRAGSEASLRAFVDEMAEGALEIDFRWVDEIPLAASGKPRPVVSNLDQRSLASQA